MVSASLLPAAGSMQAGLAAAVGAISMGPRVEPLYSLKNSKAISGMLASYL